MNIKYKQIKWFNIKPNYHINEYGTVVNINSDKKLKPWLNNKNNYLYYTLRTNDNKSIHIAMHVLVFVTFGNKSDVKKYIKNLGKYKYVIDHINPIEHGKMNIEKYHISNLRLSTYKENYMYAKDNGLISTCDSLKYSKSSNNDIINICKCLEKGMSNIDIIKKLNLEDSDYTRSLIIGIKTGRRWKDISSKFNFEKTSGLRKHTDEYIDIICQMIDHGVKLKEMRYLLNVKKENKDSFKKLVYGIKKRKIYKDISESYNWWKNCSTTIENNKDFVLFNSKSFCE